MYFTRVFPLCFRARWVGVPALRTLGRFSSSKSLKRLFELPGYQKLFFNWVSGTDRGSYEHYGKHLFDGEEGMSTRFLEKFSNEKQYSRLVACVLAHPNYWVYNHAKDRLVLLGVFDFQIGESTEGNGPCNCLLVAVQPHKWVFCSGYPVLLSKLSSLQNSKFYSNFGC